MWNKNPKGKKTEYLSRANKKKNNTCEQYRGEWRMGAMTRGGK